MVGTPVQQAIQIARLPKRRNQVGGLTLLDFKTSYKAIITKSFTWHCRKDRNTDQEVEWKK
jgi:hypothetical protein